MDREERIGLYRLQDKRSQKDDHTGRQLDYLPIEDSRISRLEGGDIITHVHRRHRQVISPLSWKGIDTNRVSSGNIIFTPAASHEFSLSYSVKYIYTQVSN